MSEWNQDAVRKLIKDILAKNCEQTGVSLAGIGDDDDLYASGVIDSYGLVDLLVELEHQTGLGAEWQMALPDGDGTTPLVLSINRLSQTLIQK